MNLRDIIKKDSDRLFYVDPECYILFTGDSVHDEQPFIRVGNWIDMPVELIPLIENIIITDSMVGNPGHEQFNIDVRVLSSNRYIGSETIVRRYLDFQKLFGLDLTNAAIVNIEKDIPELSKEKNISENNQFIGVFYRDGNFKTVHGGNTILDLKSSENESLARNIIHDRLVEETRGSDRYSGSGIVLTEHNPMFFHNGAFISYLLPSQYLEVFRRLSVNPLKIRSVIYPSTNYINISQFLKWKHHRRDRVTVYSDSSEDIRNIKNLFRNTTLNREDFSGMKYNSGDGLIIENYPDSFNIRAGFKQRGGDSEDLSVAFVKSATGISQVIKDSLDAVFIEYSAYEDSTLLFKSTSTPVAIINDTAFDITSRFGRGTMVLQKDRQYNFRKIKDADILFRDYGKGLQGLLSGDTSETESLLKRMDSVKEKDTASLIRHFNTLSIIQVVMDTTTDRKHLQELRKLQNEFSVPSGIPGSYTFELVFHDRHIYLFVPNVGDTHIEKQAAGVLTEDDSGINISERILQDRRRLASLLALFRNEGILSSQKLSTETALLKEAIDKRREHYAADIHIGNGLSAENGDSGSIFTGILKKAIDKKNEYHHGNTPFGGDTEDTPKGLHGILKRAVNRRAEGHEAGTVADAPPRGITGSQSGGAPETGNGTALPENTDLASLYGKSAKSQSEAKSGTNLRNKADYDMSGEMTRNPMQDREKQRFKKLAAPLGGLILLVIVFLFFLFSGNGKKDRGDSGAEENTTGLESMDGKDSSSSADRGRNTGGRENSGKENETATPSNAIPGKKAMELYTTIPEEFKSPISDTDIYRYANRVAIKNGYTELSAVTIKSRDPDWIYPRNVFVMLDGQRVTVVEGDTLWDIARRKLIEMDLNFYNTVKKIKKGSGTEKEELIKKAEGYSFSGKHRKTLESLRARND